MFIAIALLFLAIGGLCVMLVLGATMLAWSGVHMAAEHLERRAEGRRRRVGSRGREGAPAAAPDGHGNEVTGP